MRRWDALVGVVAAAAVVALAACSGTPDEGLSTFAYDADAPLAVVDHGVVNAPYPVAVHDISYASGDDRVEAFLAVPPGSGSRPGVLYLHGAGGDRAQLREPALWLAARGVVTLTITAPSDADPPAELTPSEALDRFREQVVRDVVAARRGLDLLVANRDVDARRLGLVGWSAGGRAGALLSGVEPRLRAVVLLAPGTAPLSDLVGTVPPELRDAAEETLRQIDPFAAIGKAREGEVLIQAGRRDDVVPARAIEALYEAAPKGSELRWYDAGHALDETAVREHLDWLTRELDVSGPAVPGAATGP